MRTHRRIDEIDAPHLNDYVKINSGYGTNQLYDNTLVLSYFNEKNRNILDSDIIYDNIWKICDILIAKFGYTSFYIFQAKTPSITQFIYFYAKDEYLFDMFRKVVKEEAICEHNALLTKKYKIPTKLF